MIAGDNESVVYNDCSGATHVLSAIAVALLQHLQQYGALHVPAIAAHLATAWEFDADDDARQVTRGLLAELDALGMIEAAPS